MKIGLLLALAGVLLTVVSLKIHDHAPRNAVVPYDTVRLDLEAGTQQAWDTVYDVVKMDNGNTSPQNEVAGVIFSQAIELRYTPKGGTLNAEGHRIDGPWILLWTLGPSEGVAEGNTLSEVLRSMAATMEGTVVLINEKAAWP